MSEELDAFDQNYRSVHLQPGMPLFADDWNDMDIIHHRQFQVLLQWLLAKQGVLQIDPDTKWLDVVEDGFFQKLVFGEGMFAINHHLVHLSSQLPRSGEVGEQLRYTPQELATLAQESLPAGIDAGSDHIFGVWLEVAFVEQTSDPAWGEKGSKRKKIELRADARYLAEHVQSPDDGYWQKLRTAFVPFWQNDTFSPFAEKKADGKKYLIAMGLVKMKFNGGDNITNWGTLQIYPTENSGVQLPADLRLPPRAQLRQSV